jgi:hypothetical protein
MKKIFISIVSASLVSPMYADAITDGISSAGDAVYGYTTYVQAIGFVIAAVVGMIGAYSIYFAMMNNAPDIRKRILTWGGGCVTMLCMSIALPKFFDYQEGLSSGSGNSGGLADMSGKFIGGDKYGQLIAEIPDLSDPRWKIDPTYTIGKPRIFPKKRTIN